MNVNLSLFFIVGGAEVWNDGLTLALPCEPCPQSLIFQIESTAFCLGQLCTMILLPLPPI